RDVVFEVTLETRTRRDPDISFVVAENREHAVVRVVELVRDTTDLHMLGLVRMVDAKESLTHRAYPHPSEPIIEQSKSAPFFFKTIVSDRVERSRQMPRIGGPDGARGIFLEIPN